jgi:hypothetical protein
MQDSSTPYKAAGICPCEMNEFGDRKRCSKGKHGDCRGSCPYRQLFCLGRARFHLPLARLGKTPLSDEERQLLAPNDVDGGFQLRNFNITNSIFLYEQTELQEKYVWDELAGFLGLSHIPNTKYHRSVGRGANHSLCDPEYDAFRAKLMPYSYELSMWLRRYFLPVANDPNRPDVRVANVERFAAITRSYTEDPCHRLIRTENGTYVLNATFGMMLPAPA